MNRKRYLLFADVVVVALGNLRYRERSRMRRRTGKRGWGEGTLGYDTTEIVDRNHARFHYTGRESFKEIIRGQQFERATWNSLFYRIPLSRLVVLHERHRHGLSRCYLSESFSSTVTIFVPPAISKRRCAAVCMDRLYSFRFVTRSTSIYSIRSKAKFKKKYIYFLLK